MVACLLLVCPSIFLFTPLPASADTTITIHITGSTRPLGFLPEWVTVHVNEPVVFLNDALPAATYTLIAHDDSFFSPPITTGHQWTMSFSKPGAHMYHDLAFAQYMVGEIVVVSASAELFPTPAPAAIATVIAQIKQPTIRKQAPTSGIPFTGWLIVAFVFVLLLMSLAGVMLYRQRRRA